jgi:hypothetical protein
MAPFVLSRPVKRLVRNKISKHQTGGLLCQVHCMRVLVGEHGGRGPGNDQEREQYQ